MRPNTPFSYAALLGFALLLIATLPARGDFSGYYAPANFTLTNTNANGTVNTALAPASIAITGGNNGSGNPGTTDFTIAAPAAGLVSFDWAYASADLPTLDDAGFLLNGTYIQLAPVGGLLGTFGLAVQAGDTFGFRSATGDNTEGAGTFTVSNFSGPAAAIPEPATWTMLTFGSAVMATALRRRRNR
jgi:hypothetical protein